MKAYMSDQGARELYATPAFCLDRPSTQAVREAERILAETASGPAQTPEMWAEWDDTPLSEMRADGDYAEILAESLARFVGES